MLHPGSDKDFELWKNAPEIFFRLNRDTIQEIISDNCFYGHRSVKLLREWNEEILDIMQSESIVEKLNTYTHQSSFLGFYSLVLKEQVALLSKNEDIKLLHEDFNTLVMKYKPLAEMLIHKMLKLHPKWNLSEPDLIQQVMTNILAKKEYITSLYNNHLPFCRYLWSTIHNEIINLINNEIRFRKHNEPITVADADKLIIDQVSELNLMIGDSLKIFHDRTLTYLEKKPRLILCLKTRFKIKISNKNLEELFPNSHQTKDFQVAASFLDRLNREQSITKRYEMLRHILNAAENTGTDEESYRRWTDLQIERLIDYLNTCYFLSLDHKSFAILIDRYFNKFNDQ